MSNEICKMEKIITELKESLEDAYLMSRPIFGCRSCTEVEDKCYRMALEYAMQIVADVFDDNGYDVGEYFEDDYEYEYDYEDDYDYEDLEED